MNENLDLKVDNINNGFDVFVCDNNIFVEHFDSKKILFIDRTYYSMILYNNKNEFDNFNVLEKIHCDSILGIIEIEKINYLIIVEKSFNSAKIGKNFIFKILKINFIKLSQNLSNESNENNNNNSILVINNLKNLLENGSFYFSNGLDITQSYQKKYDFFTENKGNVFYGLIQNCNSDFMFNYLLIKKFLQYKIDEIFISCCICGYVEMKQTIPFNENNILDIILIERINKNSIDISNENNININNYSNEFKEIEIVLVFNQKDLFSFIIGESFVPFELIKSNSFNLFKIFQNYTKNNLEKFKTIFSIFNFLQDDNKISYLNEENKQKLLEIIYDSNFIFKTKMKEFIFSEKSDFITFLENKQINNFLDFYGRFKKKKKKKKNISQNFIFWLININHFNSLNKLCLNFLVRLIWIYIKKIINFLFNFDIGDFSKENKNVILNQIKTLWSNYYENLLNFPQSLKNIKERNKIQYCINYLINENEIINQSINLKEKLNLLIISWNVAGISSDPNNNYDLSNLFNSNILYKNNSSPEIIAIGLQEIVKLNIENILINSNIKNVNDWRGIIYNYIKKIYSNDEYICINNQNLIGILFLVYVKKSIYHNINIIESNVIKTGGYGTMGNKGICLFALKYYENNFVFCTGHFPAGQNEINARLNLLEQILNSKIKNENFKDYEFFIFGDLNFRINKNFQDVIYDLQQNNLNNLRNYDQLNIARNNFYNKFFIVNEGVLNFYPTYKYAFRQNNYYYNEKKVRVPSWCDRILFKNYNYNNNNNNNNDNNIINLLEYNSIGNIIYSDHRPVYGVFRLNINNILSDIKDVLIYKMKNL